MEEKALCYPHLRRQGEGEGQGESQGQGEGEGDVERVVGLATEGGEDPMDLS
jgi:CTD kinase subunit gamma